MKIKNITLPLIALAIVGCSGGNNVASTTGGTGSSSSGGAVTLRLKPKAGTTYVLENSTDQGGMSQSSTMETKIIESDGSKVVMESTVTESTGPAAAQMKGMKMTITASPMYQIQSVKIDSKDAMVAQMGKAMESSLKMMPVFPENAVKPGDTWKGSFDLGQMMKDMGLPVTFKGDTVMEMTMTFKGVEDKDGRKVAVVTNTADDKLTMSMGGQDQDMNMKITGETYFDLETGMSVGSSTESRTGANGTEQVNKTTVKLKEIK